MLAIVLSVTIFLLGCTETTVINEALHPNMTHQKNLAFATPENPVASPSGHYVLTIQSGYSEVYYNQFVVVTQSDSEQTIFNSDTPYRTRDMLYFCWDSDDNIWVYSGDIGITLWRFDEANRTWKEEYPAKDSPPEILNEYL